MTKKILYTTLESVEDILSKLKKNLKPKKQSKVLTLFLTWGDIAGHKLAEFSRPVGLSKEKTLIVACKYPAISQELYAMKSRILKAVQFYANDLGLKVDDVCFSYKIWEKYNKEGA